MTVKFADGKEVRIYFQYQSRMRKKVSRRVVIANLERVGSGFAFGAPTECSTQDQFNKAVGRRKALTDLLSSCEFVRTQRTEIWREYFYHHNDLKPDSKHSVGRDKLDVIKQKAANWDRLAERAEQAIKENITGPGYTAEQMKLLHRKAAAFDYLCENEKDFLWRNFGSPEPTFLEAVGRDSIKK